MQAQLQRTLKKEVSLSGCGVHTGEKVFLRFCPSPENSGIVFERTDLPGSPKVSASIGYAKDSVRSTTIGKGLATVRTVEHVLAALYSCGVDNLRVQINAEELPIVDGSAEPFVELIQQGEIVEQQAKRKIYFVQRPFYYSAGNVHLVVIPSEEYRISYTLHYPKVAAIRSQYLSLTVNEETFKEQIAPARTFVLFKEVEILKKQNLIKGGSLQSAVVIKDEGVVNKEGLRFSDEMVRHKILDLIGDLALVGCAFRAHIIAACSGHQANVELGKLFEQNLDVQRNSL